MPEILEAPATPETPVLAQGTDAAQPVIDIVPEKPEDLLPEGAAAPEPGGDYDYGAPERGSEEDDAEKPADPKAEGEAAPTDAQPADSTALPAELLHEAGRLGFSSADIAEFKTAGALSAAIRNAHLLIGHFARQLPQQQPMAPQQPQADPWEPLTKLDAEAERKALLDKGYDESIADVILSEKKARAEQARLAQAQARRLAEVEDLSRRQVEWQRQQYFQQQQQAWNHQVDSFLADNKDDFADIDSPEKKTLLLSQALTLGAGYENARVQPPPFTELLKQAAYAMTGDKLRDKARESVRAEVRKSQTRATARPKGRQAGHEPTGEAAAVEHVAGILKAKGLMP